MTGEAPPGPEAARAGWVSISSPPGGGTHMRVTQRPDGRWGVDAVYVHGPEITTSELQAVPVGQLELMINLVPADIGDMEIVNRFGGYDNAIVIEPGEGKEPALAELRALAADAPNGLRSWLEAPGGRQALTRPDGSDPDAFYAQVAQAYREYAPRTRAPAVEIAKEAGVPVGTARGWIREARRRGHLPAGRQGKAG